ncbi:hypothetical protein GCM10010495_80570 [Kitasatospora herbaricolor]|uniref:hypothetical protein n=1 Tax=Kitasatospora herbaricolor TaxID=68217 RepID=UPI00174A0577|nr:hypothetical protein [Kitasatospora herbaricolor]MDQ0308683.1 hypothetical protein [Kitasatospora herbaricolor]GGV50769.1 hypothetical protein GCM10010495_80570 [Kitasatospora herbaricolor]
MPNEINRGPLPDPWRPVNITVPVTVANDFDQMQSVIKDVMTQLGCPTCHSGRDLRINIATDFVVNPAGQVHQAVGFSFGG